MGCGICARWYSVNSTFFNRKYLGGVMDINLSEVEEIFNYTVLIFLIIVFFCVFSKKSSKIGAI